MSFRGIIGKLLFGCGIMRMLVITSLGSLERISIDSSLGCLVLFIWQIAWVSLVIGRLISGVDLVQIHGKILFHDHYA